MAVERAKKINPHLFSASLWGGLLMLFSGIWFSDSLGYGVLLMILAGWGLMIFAVIYSLVCLHSCWALIEGTTARTSAARAAAFLFIPIFNLYWLFVAFKGLATDANKYLESKGRGDLKISGGVSLAYCICVLVPVATWFSPVLLTILIYQWARFHNAVIEDQAMNVETASAMAAYRAEKEGDAAVWMAVALAVIGTVFIIGMMVRVVAPVFEGYREKGQKEVMMSNARRAMMMMEGAKKECGAYPDLGRLGPGPFTHRISLAGVGTCKAGMRKFSVEGGDRYEFILTQDGYEARAENDKVGHALAFDNTGRLQWVEKGR